MPRPFRFGVQISDAPDRRSFVAAVQRAEDLGYSVVSVADHLDNQFATTPALMAAADATSTIRLASVVYAVDYHHPVVLAKEAATLDLLSDGRLEFGLGAGWMTTDYEQAGIVLDRPSVRIGRLAEAITVIKGLFADESFTFNGDHYRVTNLDGRPKPLQSPHPPIFVGGGGRKVLELAAREADIIGLNIRLDAGRIDAHAGPTATVAATDEKLAWIRAAAGDRFDDLELQVRIHLLSVTDDVRALAEAVGPSLGLTPEEAMASPHALAGSEDEIVEACIERRERFGISYVTVGAESLAEFAPVVERLAGT